jgi:hypothetical protein
MEAGVELSTISLCCFFAACNAACGPALLHKRINCHSQSHCISIMLYGRQDSFSRLALHLCVVVVVVVVVVTDKRMHSHTMHSVLLLLLLLLL